MESALGTVAITLPDCQFFLSAYKRVEYIVGWAMTVAIPLNYLTL